MIKCPTCASTEPKATCAIGLSLLDIGLFSYSFFHVIYGSLDMTECHMCASTEPTGRRVVELSILDIGLFLRDAFLFHEM